MPKQSHSGYLPQLKRLKQRTLAHCGPAVLAMLSGFIGQTFDQDRFVTAARVKRDTLRKFGMDMDQMARAVMKLIPNTVFWIKRESNIDDVKFITNTFQYPVGVEWQGIFGEWSNGDDGHYSVIIHVDTSKQRLFLIDPFWFYSGSDRIFSIDAFVPRWWDATIRVNKKTGEIVRDVDQRFMFVITPEHEIFPRTIGMEPYKSRKYIRFGGYTKE